jgi:hypothetical protein
LCELWKNKYKKNYFLKFLNHWTFSSVNDANIVSPYNGVRQFFN